MCPAPTLVSPFLSSPAVGHSPRTAGFSVHPSKVSQLRCLPPRGAGGSHRQLGWQHYLLPGRWTQSHQGNKVLRRLSRRTRRTGKIVAVGRIDGTVELWAWQEGARLAAFPAQCGCVSAVLFLHAGDRFLTAGEDGKVSFQRVCGFWDRVAKVGMCSGCAGGLY